MTTGYLYVLHGRRGKIPESNLELLNGFIADSGQLGRIAFLEGDEQTLEDGILALQPQIDHLVIVPVLLYSATHTRWDIPERSAKVLDPSLKVTVTKTLAETKAVEQYLERTLGAAVAAFPHRRILLIAHGTPHFPEPYAHLQALAKSVGEAIGTEIVPTNHVGHPTIEETLAGEHGPFIVERLFLTDGRLAAKMKQRVQAIEDGDVFLPTLEDDPVIINAIRERLAEAGV